MHIAPFCDLSFFFLYSVLFCEYAFLVISCAVEHVFIKFFEAFVVVELFGSTFDSNDSFGSCLGKPKDGSVYRAWTGWTKLNSKPFLLLMIQVVDTGDKYSIFISFVLLIVVDSCRINRSHCHFCHSSKIFSMKLMLCRFFSTFLLLPHFSAFQQHRQYHQFTVLGKGGS